MARIQGPQIKVEVKLVEGMWQRWVDGEPERCPRCSVPSEWENKNGRPGMIVLCRCQERSRTKRSDTRQDDIDFARRLGDGCRMSEMD
jgi:hypothetical protein